jgi:DNA-binding NarL/FixJ family response regulator
VRQDQIPYRILIVDDHPAIRTGLTTALEGAGLSCCGFAATKAEALAQLAHLNPDGAIVDLNLPDGNGLDLIRWARKNSEDIALVMLTMSDSDLIAAMTAGASGYVNKGAPLSEVVSVLTRALAAPRSFTATGLVGALKTAKAPQLLTQRELEVLKALTKDGDAAALATDLHISESTFKTHASSIYRKLGVTNRIGAVKIARDCGII